MGQSYLTSIWTTFIAFFSAISIVWRQRPELVRSAAETWHKIPDLSLTITNSGLPFIQVLVNGPGTCIPICFAVWLFRGLGLCKGTIVFVESIARVKSLSLSGRILYRLRMADVLFVQWSELQRLYPRTVHRGRLY